MFVANRYRLYPTEEQKVLLGKHFGCVRWVYNKGLAMKTEAWEERKENLTRYDIQKHIPLWKACDETAWLSEVGGQSLQSALCNLEIAFTKFFREKKGYPKFKSKHDKQSFQVPQRGRVGHNYIHIPKLLEIRAVISRPCVGTVKSITVTKTPSGKYFATVFCDNGQALPIKRPVTESGTVGIDLGLKDFAVLSTGERIKNPRKLKKAKGQLARAQRRCSSKVVGSKNRNKARMRAARVYEKVTNRRKDFLHKLTTRLVRDNQTNAFAIEDLDVEGMLQNKRLAYSIGDAGWGAFRKMLNYKSERAGKTVMVIGQYEPSSKACSCGKINSLLKLSDRSWTCTCGLKHDRDLNAANNIKRFALHPQNHLVGRVTPEFTPAEIAVR